MRRFSLGNERVSRPHLPHHYPGIFRFQAMLSQLRHHHRAHLRATGMINAVLYENIGNGLRSGIRIGFEKVADFDGTGLLFWVGVLLAAPDQESDDGGEQSDDQKLHGVEPISTRLNDSPIKRLPDEKYER